MNKTFKYALTAVLGAALAVPAMAQDYPDVKDSHWAYDALRILREKGILVGYPDGNFYGKKLVTRYELASAIYQIYASYANVFKDYDAKLAALEQKVNGMGQNTGRNTGGDNGMGDVRDTIAGLRTEVASIKEKDIKALADRVGKFEKELTSMGVDVEAMKKDLIDLSKRVKALEDKKPSVSISGDINFYVSTGIAGSTDRAGEKIGINQDGRSFGYGTNGAAGSGLFDDLAVLHEVALKLSSTNETGPTWHATVLTGNTLGGLGQGFGDQASVAAQFGQAYREGNTTFVIQEAVVDLGSQSLAGLGFTAKVGRQGLKVSPWLFERVDNTSFFSNERWDNGEFLIDGATIGYKFGGSTKLNLVLGRASNSATSGGGVLQPILVGGEQLIAGLSAASGATVLGAGGGLQGPLSVDRVFGATLSTGIGKEGSLNATYMLLDSDNSVAVGTQTAAPTVNRTELLGADASFKVLNNFTISGGYGQTNFKNKDNSVLDDDNTRWNVGLGYSAGKLNVNAGYLEVESNYLAPGNWGRVGIFRNPVNVKGFTGAVDFKVNDSLSVMGNVLIAEQLMGGNGEVESFAGGLKYAFSNGIDLGISYEQTELTNYAVVNPTYKFTTVSLGYNFSAATKFLLTAQYADIEGHPFNLGGGVTNTKGLYLGTQLSVRF